MKRTPLARGTKPLARKTRVKAKRATTRRSARVHDAAYMERVRGLPCVAAELCMWWAVFGGGSACDGRIHAHHMGARGLGQKCSDLETVPFCERHHRDWHDCAGPFAGKSKEWRGEFARAAIEYTHATLEVSA